MYVWSKRLIGGLLAGFFLLFLLFLFTGLSANTSLLKSHTTFWITLNYIGLLIWIFVWMIDQGRVRGQNVWLWLVPFLLAPLPVLGAFILVLQKKRK